MLLPLLLCGKSGTALLFFAQNYGILFVYAKSIHKIQTETMRKGGRFDDHTTT